MEQLPRGAQFTRSKMLWEIALGIAGDPNIRYYEDRDVSIVIGNGSGEAFTPALRMAPGSPALAHAVARGDLDMAFVNPSGMLTQAYRGTGLYSEPLPVRVIASYPSYDRFVAAVHPRLGVTSLAEIAEQKPGPARLRARGRNPLDARAAGPTAADVRLHAGRLRGVGRQPAAERPARRRTAAGGHRRGEPRRGVRRGDGAGVAELSQARVAAGCWSTGHPASPLELESLPDEVTCSRRWRPRASGSWGRRRRLAAGGVSCCRRMGIFRFDRPLLERDIMTIDYSGWPLYTRSRCPSTSSRRWRGAYNACLPGGGAAIAERAESGRRVLCHETSGGRAATRAVGQLPIHQRGRRRRRRRSTTCRCTRAAERWFRETLTFGHIYRKPGGPSTGSGRTPSAA